MFLSTRWMYRLGCSLEHAAHTRLAACKRVYRCSGTVLNQHYRSASYFKTKQFDVKKVVLLKKTTRYEYEKQLLQSTSEEELKTYLTNKGSDYRGLLKRHDEYQRRLEKIHRVLSAAGLTVRLCGRREYDHDVIHWADVVVSAGGDGTFLLAASKIDGKHTPVIGVNTDALRSEGFLCLPERYSVNFRLALEKLMNDEFEWRYRQRIRITMSGSYSDEPPLDLHDQALEFPEHRFHEHVREHETERTAGLRETRAQRPPRRLPLLALNEVFVGESLSARVSFYEISINGSRAMKQKSSGVTICTGTGSTSWYLHINQLPRQSVTDILRIASEQGGQRGEQHLDAGFVSRVTERFNSSLRFSPHHLHMAFVIRDPVVNGVFQVANSRGFCNKISLRSRMWDARVVVDGSASYSFNDGACVQLEMHEEDALRCVSLPLT